MINQFARTSITETDAFSRAFIMQYISLILFILIFTVQAYSVIPLPNEKNTAIDEAAAARNEPQEPQKALVQEKLLTHMKLPTIYTDDEHLADSFLVLARILKSHDVNAEIVLYPNATRAMNLLWPAGLALKQQLKELGLPTEFITVSVSPEEKEYEGEIIVSGVTDEHN